MFNSSSVPGPAYGPLSTARGDPRAPLGKNPQTTFSSRAFLGELGTSSAGGPPPRSPLLASAEASGAGEVAVRRFLCTRLTLAPSRPASLTDREPGVFAGFSSAGCGHLCERKGCSRLSFQSSLGPWQSFPHTPDVLAPGPSPWGFSAGALAVSPTAL